MADRTLQANFSANTAGFTQGTNALRQRLTELNTSMEQTRQAVRNANQQVREYQKELRQLQQATQNGNTATSEQRSRMQELRDRIAQTTSQLGTLRTAEQDLRGQIRNTNEALNNQQAALESVTSGASTMGQVLKANLYSSAIQSAVGKLTSALKSAAQYCYSVGSSFESGMSQVAAISGASADELERLSDRAKELGTSTKFTATEISQAMNYMAMAGWDATQMLDGIDGVISLAAASGGDLATTSDIVTDAITAFGLKAEDVAHFSDVLAAASANANTNVAMMGETFQYCAPIAGALGFSIEDVSEAIGVMANSGIKSSMAGTALRTLFTKLSDEITITGQNLGRVTIQTSNADGSMRSLKDILTDMRTAFAQLTESERSSAAESIAGKYAMTGLLSLMNAGEGDVNKLRTAIEECDGAASSMADTMQNNTAGAVTVMQSALEGLGIAIYDKFGEQLRDRINGLTDVFSGLTERIDAGEFDEVFERVANSVGNAADQLIEFAKTGLPAAIEGLANLISVLVEYRGVIAGVVTGMVAFKTNMAIAKTITGLVGAIKGIVTAANAARTATQALTAAQAANNAVAAANPYLTVASAILGLVGGIAMLIGVTNSATDSMSDAAESADDLKRKTDELNQTAKEADQAAQAVSDLAEEYRDIKEASDDTKEAKERLKEIQDILIDTYGVEAEKIDLVNGKYEEQLGILQQVVDEKNEAARMAVNAAYYNQRDAITKGYTIDISGSGLTFENDVDRDVFQKSLDDRGIPAKLSDDGKSLIFNSGVSYKQAEQYLIDWGHDLEAGAFAGTGTGLYSWVANAALAANQAAADYDNVTRLYEQYNGIGIPGNGGNTTPTAPISSAGAFGVDWSDYNSVKKYYQYMRDTGQISNEKYYELAEYFANKLLDPNSEEWRTATAEIYNGRKTAPGSSGSAGSTKDPNEEAYNSDKEYLKWRLDMGYITEEEYYSQLQQLRDKYLDENSKAWRSATLEIHKYQVKKDKERFDTLKTEYDAALTAIDELEKQHERDKEDADYDRQLAEIDKQLKYDRLDDYSRQQLEQKKQEVLDEREETLRQRGIEDLKTELETVYTMAKNAYEQGTADLNAALTVASQVFSAVGTGASQLASTVSTVNNNNVNMTLGAVSYTADQIAAAVVKALTSSI